MDEWLIFMDIDPRARDLSGFQRGDQRRLLYHRPGGVFMKNAVGFIR